MENAFESVGWNILDVGSPGKEAMNSMSGNRYTTSKLMCIYINIFCYYTTIALCFCIATIAV